MNRRNWLPQAAFVGKKDFIFAIRIFQQHQQRLFAGSLMDGAGDVL